AVLRVSAVKSVLHHSASMILPFSCQFSCLILLSLLPFVKYFPVLFFCLSFFCQFLLVAAPLLRVHSWLVDSFSSRINDQMNIVRQQARDMTNNIAPEQV